MEDSSRDGEVFFIDHKQILSGHIRQKKEKIEARIERVEEDIELIQATREAMDQIETLLMNMRELAVRAAEDTTADKRELDREFQSIKARINEVVAGAEHGGVNLLDGGLPGIEAMIVAVADALR